MWHVLADIGLIVTVAITGYFAVKFSRDPEGGLRAATHRLEFLPLVMAGRYLAIALLALGAFVYGDMVVIAYFFAVCAVMGVIDTWIYWRRGLPFVTHLIPGALAVLAVGISLMALATQGGPS